MDSKQYGDINVALVDVENFADFKIRTFILSHVRSYTLHAFCDLSANLSVQSDSKQFIFTLSNAV